MTVVDHLDFAIGEGEAVALTGPSGCGKTTAVLCMLRLLEPDEGSICFDGQDLRRLSPKPLRHIRASVQILFQDAYASLNPLMSLSQLVEEPLLIHKLMNGETRRRAVMAMLERVGIESAVFNRRPSEVSIGQCQRAALARALILSPRLVVLDEPTAALDTISRRLVIDLLRERAQEGTSASLVVSHDPEVVRTLASRIAIMNNGRIANWK
ncbi:MAG TPA: dipeptide/oligopeptide/nickel ABC transporter ATP-binding protein [Tepidisphaeraceae bacterium]|jgi:ABC-type glutathione transport system ATPase component|nr:dipeptide/oligopeptide/nickel ABC transporter ATP-binding protein [Tepidisphaeraceae bacterium]